MQFLNSKKFFSKLFYSINYHNKVIRRSAYGVSYTSRSVTTISIIITVFIFLIFYFSNILFQKIICNQNSNQFVSNENQCTVNEYTANATKNNNVKNTVKNNVSGQKTNNSVNIINKPTVTASPKKTNPINKTSNTKTNDWRIVIPEVNLNAQISEGTTNEVMNKYVGHFENTSIWNGNVALAAHNRGYPVNYFANIKSLKNGDIIEYFYNGNVRKYKIKTITIITDTDWTYLSNTSDNRITLITCVENEPEYRRCIQGIEV